MIRVFRAAIAHTLRVLADLIHYEPTVVQIRPDDGEIHVYARHRVRFNVLSFSAKHPAYDIYPGDSMTINYGGDEARHEVLH